MAACVAEAEDMKITSAKAKWQGGIQTASTSARRKPASALHVNHLRCGYLVAPRLSWTIESNRRGARQPA